MAKIDQMFREYREIRQDYTLPDKDVFTAEDPKLARIKEIVLTKLCDVDRIIILLYADCASYIKLGQRLNVSHMTARKEVLRIRDIIMGYLDETEKSILEETLNENNP